LKNFGTAATMSSPVKESMRSEHDEVILARAQTEQRILVTHDKDFSELAFRSLLPPSSGVILFRLSGTVSISPTRPTTLAAASPARLR
jgi:predicted nuclease of predicted toxin-antitoxin system